jgi:hypothetical protein
MGAGTATHQALNHTLRAWDRRTDDGPAWRAAAEITSSTLNLTAAIVQLADVCGIAFGDVCGVGHESIAPRICARMRAVHTARVATAGKRRPPGS